MIRQVGLTNLAGANFFCIKGTSFYYIFLILRLQQRILGCSFEADIAVFILLGSLTISVYSNEINTRPLPLSAPFDIR
jgi:hypothetical protein